MRISKKTLMSLLLLSLAHALGGQYGGEVFQVYTHALRGFAVRMPEAAARHSRQCHVERGDGCWNRLPEPAALHKRLIEA
jgi:hypothetical protein